MSKTILCTGGLGFLGSNLCNYLNKKYPDSKIVIVDKGTYAADVKNLDFQPEAIIMRDLCLGVSDVLTTYKPDVVLHLASESSVDKSLDSSYVFWQSNVMGTVVFLEQVAKIVPDCRLIHVSTDEVIGPWKGRANNFAGTHKPESEMMDLRPSSPYSASKAAQELAVRSIIDRYDLRAKWCIVRPNNIYGPRQDNCKLIPRVIELIKEGKPIPVYGKGEQMRHWLYVNDICVAFDKILNFKTYVPVVCFNLPAMHSSERTNIELISLISNIMKTKGFDNLHVEFVPDRKNHDQRYYTDGSLAEYVFGWNAFTPLEEGLAKTIDWYLTQNK